MTTLNNSLNICSPNPQLSLENSLYELSKKISKLKKEKNNPTVWEEIALAVICAVTFTLSAIGVFWALSHIDSRDIGAGSGAWAMAIGLTAAVMGPTHMISEILCNYFEYRRYQKLQGLYKEMDALYEKRNALRNPIP